MKARRKIFSAQFDTPGHATAQLDVANGEETRGDLSDLDLRILDELSKARHSRLSDAVANCIKDRRATVETGLQRMLGLGLVRRPKNSKNGFKITETGRAALLAAVHRFSLKPTVE